MDALARERCRCDLAAEVLQSQGTLQVRATGVSMLPTLWPGDFLTIQSCTLQEVQLGDIVLFRRKGRFFVHRLVSKSVSDDELFLITRGDSMPEFDPPVRAGELLGKITEIRRESRFFMPRRRLSSFRLLLGWILCHSDLSSRVALRFHSLRRVYPQMAETGRFLHSEGTRA